MKEIEGIIEEHYDELSQLGKDGLKVEVTNISSHGIWLPVGEGELFLSFKDFPWFKDASKRYTFFSRYLFIQSSSQIFFIFTSGRFIIFYAL
jgi:hypothetical protein